MSDSAQLPASLSPPPTSTAADHAARGAYNPRKRGRTACTRCKHRKQKCDDQWPSCSNCTKAGTECDKSAVSEDEPPVAYTRALEQRVAFLEARLSETSGREGQGLSQTPSSTTRTQPRNNVLAEAVELLALGNIEAPAYVGASSGLNLALTLGDMVQATVWNKALPLEADVAQSSNVDSQDKNRGGRVLTRQEMVSRSAEPPSDEHGTLLVNAYLNQPHNRYPFIDEAEVWTLHAKRMSLNSTPVQQLTKAERFGLFKLNMVYAIGAMLIQLTERRTTTPPEDYYMTALRYVSTAKESKTTQNVEAMLLLVIYHVRSSSYGIWYMIGLAMRTCIDLGLHTKRHERNLDPYAIQMRRRLFWSVYALERTIAICLGRPLSIPDRQIDVELPLDVAEGGSWEEMSSAQLTSPPKKNSLSMTIMLFKMRRIESRIQFSIYRADKPLSALTPKLNQLYQDLEMWKTSLEERFGGIDLNYPMLHYHRAVRLLIQPFLSLLTPSDPYYLICMRAAGGVCQAHKKLHQSLEYGHSFIAVQTVFVAGITLLYGLWTQQHAIWSVAMSNDLRACSLVLFVMGERAPWVRKYRDAFEVLVNATMEKLENGVNNLAETAAVQMRNVTNNNSDSATENFESFVQGEDGDAWKVVAELANWIDQPEGSMVWMPDFELLQNLSPV
ncbi:fungal-specific transcription factor domain-containing protein [Xylariaceae sp. FL1272]|nr:fungal-specific transcription factor domain-containing protein [Xylariaceae sp. FL1272]